MAALVGTLRPNGRIQFCKEDNPTIFGQIAKSKRPVNRIKVVPKQQTIEIRQPEKDSETDFVWLDEFRTKLLTADAVFLSHKDGALRFGSAIHQADKHSKFFTIGTADEATKFAEERWSSVRYFFAQKHDEFRFAMTRMMTHKKGQELDGKIELPIRLDDFGGEQEDPLTIFDATGASATVEIVDWRNSVGPGAVGRFAVDGKRVKILVTKTSCPFTFLEEYREEYGNFGYTFSCDKMKQRLQKLLAAKQKNLEASA